MKIAVDTNILVRAILQDDPAQGHTARETLKNATLIAISLSCLCELIWVLRQGAKLSRQEVATIVRNLTNSGTIVTNRAAVATGLAILEAGGDFADGILAHEGAALGGDTFISFDKKAVDLLNRQGMPARFPG